tara:strand:+ start:11842 stop:12120 length:279 start_codon:yes stop_codon:yes gene_type:complete
MHTVFPWLDVLEYEVVTASFQRQPSEAIIQIHAHARILARDATLNLYCSSRLYDELSNVPQWRLWHFEPLTRTDYALAVHDSQHMLADKMSS